MSRKRTTVVQLAREANIHPDEALIALWYDGFTDLNTPADVVTRRFTNRARRVLGLATRRELATAEYWQERLGISRAEMDARLAEAGVANAYEGGRLRTKAIHRLQAIAREVDQEGARLESTDEIASLQAMPWHVVGHVRDSLSHLTVEDVEQIHATLVEDFRAGAEPIDPPGIRSANLLASAVMRPQTSLGDESKYPTIEMAGAALFHSLVHDHPFHNGNKRTALVSLLVFLDENGLCLTCHEEELFWTVLQVAQHGLVRAPRNELADQECLAIANWIKDNSRWAEKGDRPITWRRLEQILSRYGCRCERSSGSNVTITRQVTRRVKFVPALETTKVLRAQVHVLNSGRDVSQNAIKQIRRDLQLDDDHGIDSRAFYDDEQISASDFIAKYRKTLNRLARL